MTDSTAKKVLEQSNDSNLDETMPLQTLEHLLHASDPSDVTDQTAQDEDPDSPNAHLRKIVAISESIDSRLEQIAKLLMQQGASKRAPARKKTAAKKKSSKTVTRQ